MRTELVVAGPQMSLEEAHRLMAQTGVRYLPVVEGKRYLGLLGERQLRWLLAPWAPKHLRADPQAPVGRFLQTFPVAHPDEPPEEVAFRMESARIGGMPVVEEGRLRGMVTAYDLLRGLAAFLRPQAPASRLELLVPDLEGIAAVLRALRATRTPLVGLRVYPEAGGLGFRLLLQVGALDTRPLRQHFLASGLHLLWP
ncbi:MULTISPECIES: CBS domain-containing protein [Thermus]|jgi:CBS domain-containing protein|uniref:Acetoin dehydrogenase AcuB n=1 Tax=Thermus brockianus TaxID=56956 RepID=A0A1J0LVV6_THEBO|nr:CBS domain-containing protein [Thermus brockianus]APD10250.1 acetoin dehydrogenase AcuB [Thermus brockianus]BDG16467.1 CBS domain-containing protein [Thermus brockianus]